MDRLEGLIPLSRDRSRPVTMHLVGEPIPKKKGIIYISIYQSTHVKTHVKYIKGLHVQHRLASEDWVPHSIDENHHVPYHLMIAPLPFGE